MGDGQVLVAGGANSAGALASAELFDETQDGGMWSLTGSLATPREHHTATSLADGKTLITSGYNGASDLATAELYDPAQGTFSATGSMAYTPGGWAGATLLQNGQVLVFGGMPEFGGPYWSSANLYDPTSATWSATGSMLSIKDNFAETLLASGEVLVAGGGTQCCYAFLNTSEIYNPTTGTWSASGELLDSVAWNYSVLLSNGKVLMAGGLDHNNTVLDETELYDPTTGIWSASGSLNIARMTPVLVVLGSGQVVAIGGSPLSYPQTATAAVEIYDPTTGSWSMTGSMNVPRNRPTATLLPSGRVLVAGGLDSGGNSLASCEIYDPQTATWSVTGNLSVPRANHTATLLAQ